VVSDRGLRDGVASELWRTLTRVSGVFRSAAPREGAASDVLDALG
jgi:hypothetical protein